MNLNYYEPGELVVGMLSIINLETIDTITGLSLMIV